MSAPRGGPVPLSECVEEVRNELLERDDETEG